MNYKSRLCEICGLSKALNQILELQRYQNVISSVFYNTSLKFEKLLDEDKIRLKVYSLLFLFIPHILVTFQTS